MQQARMQRQAEEGYYPAWTEYTLYYLFAYHSGLNDLYHTPGNHDRWYYCKQSECLCAPLQMFLLACLFLDLAVCASDTGSLLLYGCLCA